MTVPHEQNQRRYQFIIEIEPLTVGKIYPTLPLHLTLLSRFLVACSPEDIAKPAQALFTTSSQIPLRIDNCTELGPQKTPVYLIENSPLLSNLHYNTCSMVDALHATCEYPQYTRENYKPHISTRPERTMDVGSDLIATAAYLIEIVEAERVVRARYRLG